ncbi:hypothetical protein EON82_24470 [bacterium]|nr:MAG: hypothetical protein EON82_24470 [bacterium]
MKDRVNAPNRDALNPDGEGGTGNQIPRGDDAGIQSPTTTGGDQTEERRVVPTEGPTTDDERRQAES